MTRYQTFPLVKNLKVILYFSTGHWSPVASVFVHDKQDELFLWCVFDEIAAQFKEVNFNFWRKKKMTASKAGPDSGGGRVHIVSPTDGCRDSRWMSAPCRRSRDWQLESEQANGLESDRSEMFCCWKRLRAMDRARSIQSQDVYSTASTTTTWSTSCHFM